MTLLASSPQHTYSDALDRSPLQQPRSSYPSSPHLSPSLPISPHISGLRTPRLPTAQCRPPALTCVCVLPMPGRGGGQRRARCRRGGRCQRGWRPGDGAPVGAAVVERDARGRARAPARRHRSASRRRLCHSNTVAVRVAAAAPAPRRRRRRGGGLAADALLAAALRQDASLPGRARRLLARRAHCPRAGRCGAARRARDGDVQDVSRTCPRHVRDMSHRRRAPST